MELLTLILALSVVMWYCIDRVKPLWENAAKGNYITMAVAAVFGFALAFAYDLDLVFALELVAEASLTGKILTGLVLMGGSSAVSEIIGKVKV